MTRPIDPYHRFLGIPPHLQPPNLYRLLGLELFERNSDVIEDAAERQMAHVRKYEGTPYADAAKKLIEELAQARVCLLLPDRKAAYDAALRKQLASATAPALAPARPFVAAGPPSEEEEEELILVPDKPRKAAPSPPAPSKSGSGVALHRAASAASGSAASLPPAAPRPVSPPAAAKDYSPVDPLKYEPPYLGEYRRRFFETLLKVAIVIFILILSLLLFNAFLLPWLKEGRTAREPSPGEEAETSAPAKYMPPPPPSLPNPANDDAATEAENSPLSEIPAENPPDPESERVSIYKTIQTAIRNDKIRRTRCVGDDSGEDFEAKHGDGGLLVALKLTWKKFGKNGESRAVASLQPEYSTPLGYIKGSIIGTPQKNGVRFLARQGYAVGALKINCTPGGRDKIGRIIGLRIVFMRVEGLRLNPKDSYLSSPFPLEHSVPFDAPEIGGNGDLIVGLFGSASGEDLLSLGLLFVKQSPPPANADSRQTPPNAVNPSGETPLPPEGKEYFLGSWHIYEDGRFSSTIALHGNGNARDPRYHEKGGKWEWKDDRARILWKDGWTDVLKRDGDTVRKHSFAPGDPEERFPVNEGTAARSPKSLEE
ncbi:MAG: hypothetical protein IT426_05340 [Pirellulales bacterium]|nr:hypothetical protein [Pirellulales bacterium]